VVAAVASHFEPVVEEAASEFELVVRPLCVKFTDIKAKCSDKNDCSEKNNNIL